MPTIRRTATLLGFLALTASAGQAQTLSAQEVVSLHAGQCISYWGPSRGSQCFGADGTTSFRDRRHGTGAGRWEMRGNEMCVRWDGDADWDCGPIWRVDAETFTDGEYSCRLN